MIEPAYIRKIKRGKGDGLWGSYPVEEDGFGTWLFTPEQSLYRGTQGDEVHICHAGWPEPPGTPVIHLIPRSGWWFARWQAGPSGAHVAIDICTPCNRERDVWSYFDLELDLVKHRNGHFKLVDEEEFEEARQLGYISAAEASSSLAAAQQLLARLASSDELFDVVGWAKLDEYQRLDLAPLVTFP